MKVLIAVLGVLLALVVLGWAGLRIKPRSLPVYPERSPEMKTVPLPDGLPARAVRFCRELYGDNVPLIESTVITGRASLRINGITLPGRFRFTHVAGEGYRHYIQTTFFGVPLLTVNEQYLDGTSYFEMPFGLIDNDPNTNQAANLGLWGEAIWFPAILVTDLRVPGNPSMM